MSPAVGRVPAAFCKGFCVVAGRHTEWNSCGDGEPVAFCKGFCCVVGGRTEESYGGCVPTAFIKVYGNAAGGYTEGNHMGIAYPPHPITFLGAGSAMSHFRFNDSSIQIP